MSVQRRAAGDRNLDWLVERIRDEEVGALRFVGCRIEGTSNIFTFEELTRVPDKPWLIGEAGQPPVPASLDWTGEMLVEGTRTPVKLYRQPRPGVSAAPSDSLVLAREFPSDPVAFPSMRGNVVVSRALSALGKNTVYELPGVSPPLSAPAWPESGARIDCSGFVAWCFRMSRKVDHPLYRSVNGGWFETSALYEDGLRNTGFFSKVDIATPGCLVVFPDKITKSGKKTEGHVGIAVAASGAGVDGITKVVHCSSGNYKRHKDAVRVTGPEIWSTRSDSLIIEYVGVTG